MLVVDNEGNVTLVHTPPKIGECPVPSHRDIESALLRIQALHGSTVGKELDVLRRAIFTKQLEIQS